MAKKEISKLDVKGKYAEAVVRGVELTSTIKALADELVGFRDTVLDKTLKIPEGDQSIRLVAPVTGDTALLSEKRSVTVTPTDDLKKNILAGMYSGVLKVDRQIALKNPADMDKVMAILNAAGIDATDVWAIKTSAAALDTYREEKGADKVLGAATEVKKVISVEFEIK